MIEISELTNYIETKLKNALDGLKSINNLLDNLEFKLFTDTGKLMEDVREQYSNTVTEYINGVVNVGNSDKYILSNGVEFTSLPLRVELIVRLERDEYDGEIVEQNIENGEITVTKAFMGNSEKLSAIRQVLDNAFESQLIETFTDNNDKSYMTSIIAQVSQGGIRESKGIIGYSYSYFINFYFNFMGNGINSQNGVFMLDGVEVPYTQSTISKIKNVDQNLFSNASGQMVGVPTFTQTSFTFDIPALTNAPTATFLKELLETNDINTFHVLTFKIENKTYDYLVNISEVDGNLSGVQNVGLKVTFGFAPPFYTLLSPKGWNVYKVNNSFSMSNLDNEPSIIVIFNADYSLRKIFSSTNNIMIFYSGDYVFTNFDFSGYGNIEEIST